MKKIVPLWSAMILVLFLLLSACGESKVSLERQVLPESDGWADYGTGTTGGSDAADDNIFTVTNRGELVDALGAGNGKPKIVYIEGEINLSVDEQNQPMGLEEYKVPKYNFQDYLQIFKEDLKEDWSQESYRAQSAQNQAERVIVNVSPNTTLIGKGKDAAITVEG